MINYPKPIPRRRWSRGRKTILDDRLCRRDSAWNIALYRPPGIVGASKTQDMVGLDISSFPSLTVGTLDGRRPPRVQKPAGTRPIIAAANHSASPITVATTSTSSAPNVRERLFSSPQTPSVEKTEYSHHCVADQFVPFLQTRNSHRWRVLGTKAAPTIQTPISSRVLGKTRHRQLGRLSFCEHHGVSQSVRVVRAAARRSLRLRGLGAR